jgi:phosphonoacetate hydrolase
LALYILDAGIKSLQEGRADFLYLTLSDYVQHKHAPVSNEADEFMGAIDDRIRQLAGMAVVGVTANHGMSSKSTADANPNVLFLEHILNEIFGEGAVRVICPITDPFVRQLNALGPFVRVYLRDIAQLTDLLKACQQSGEVEEAMTGEEAARQFYRDNIRLGYCQDEGQVASRQFQAHFLPLKKGKIYCFSLILKRDGLSGV